MAYLVSLSGFRPAAALGDVPEGDELRTRELTLVDQMLAKANIDPPAPALATTRPAYPALAAPRLDD
jgi:hypothetical protein